MLPDLGTPYLPSWAGTPPHMAPGDLPLWRRFLAKHRYLYYTLYYDAAVGEPAQVPEAATATEADMWQRITRQRIDAVGSNDAGWTIIEVRHAAGPAALGALYSYLKLWQQDPPDKRPVTPLLLTDQTTDNLLHVAQQLAINILVV